MDERSVSESRMDALNPFDTKRKRPTLGLVSGSRMVSGGGNRTGLEPSLPTTPEFTETSPMANFAFWKVKILRKTERRASRVRKHRYCDVRCARPQCAQNRQPYEEGRCKHFSRETAACDVGVGVAELIGWRDRSKWRRCQSDVSPMEAAGPPYRAAEGQVWQTHNEGIRAFEKIPSMSTQAGHDTPIAARLHIAQ